MKEGEEILVPTFEIASNSMFDLQTGKWVGDYAESSQWFGVKHFSVKSFLLWLQKDGASRV